jgi:hypothetical protein
MVFDLIERTPRSAAGRRVERILELLTTAEECRAAIQQDGLKGGLDERGADLVDEAEALHAPRNGYPCSLPIYRFKAAAIEERNQRYRDALCELQTLLLRYEWRPTVESRLYSSLGVRLLWDRTKAKDAAENRAVQFLLEQLSPHDGPARILRFRKCRECERWFYALKDRQSYCSELCRKKYASHSPEFKAQRAEYMKRYRIEEAERDARAKQLAKGKGK